MVSRISPEKYFYNGNENKTLLIIGLIILGIVACVAITAIAVRGGKNA